MASHDQIIQNYLTGNYNHDNKTERKGNSMEIVINTDKQLDRQYKGIIGYGHALYTIRIGDNAVLFTGWDGYSRTTSSHFTKLRRAINKSRYNLIEINKSPKMYTTKLQKLLGKQNIEKLPNNLQKQVIAEKL